MMGLIGPIGIPELILILVLALIIFGPSKLPEVGKSLGKSIKEFRSSTKEVQKEFNETVSDDLDKEEKIK